jgi:hypothetical protein
MSTTQIAMVGVLVLLLLWLALRRRAGTQEAAEERIDTLIGWPPQATRILTAQERLAYALLAKALPDHMILAQVPLARFVNVPKRNSYADWLRRLGYQCADFVVCDMAAQVIAVVEVQHEQPTERARKRLTRMSRTLKAAKIPLQVWTERALPSVEAVRLAILPPPAPVQAPAAVATGTRGVAPGTAGASNPFEDTDRDSSNDEHIELLEPPPSTWFDELEDSSPMPLPKR